MDACYSLQKKVSCECSSQTRIIHISLYFQNKVFQEIWRNFLWYTLVDLPGNTFDKLLCVLCWPQLHWNLVLHVSRVDRFLFSLTTGPVAIYSVSLMVAPVLQFQKEFVSFLGFFRNLCWDFSFAEDMIPIWPLIDCSNTFLELWTVTV